MTGTPLKERLYFYRIEELVRVYDGDTIHGIIDIGLRMYSGNKRRPTSVRLSGINCPEIRTRDLEEKKMGYLAKGFTLSALEGAKDIYIKIVKVKGKYGRIIADVYFTDEEDNEYNLAQLLLENGLAKIARY